MYVHDLNKRFNSKNTTTISIVCHRLDFVYLRNLD